MFIFFMVRRLSFKAALGENLKNNLIRKFVAI